MATAHQTTCFANIDVETRVHPDWENGKIIWTASAESRGNALAYVLVCLTALWQWTYEQVGYGF